MGWGEDAWGDAPWGDGDGPDVTAPSVVFSPVAGAELSELAVLAVTVTDDESGLDSATVTLSYPSGLVEIAYDGAAFGAAYAGSGQAAVSGGVGLSIVRAGGWVEPPTAIVAASDLAGNEAVVVAAFRPAVRVDRLAEIGASDRDRRSSYQGSGLVSPLQRDNKNDFAHASGTELIRANVRQILLMQSAEEQAAGDVPWDGTLGSRIHLLTHRNGTPGLDEIARHYVADAIRRFEPRARVSRVTISRHRNRTELAVKFVPTDRTGRPIGAEEDVAVTMKE